MAISKAMTAHGELIISGRPYPLDRPEAWPSTFPMREEIAAVVKSWQRNAPMEISTSGSTGAPKPIIHPLENIIRSATATAAYFVLPEHSSALLCLPVSKIAGRMQVYRALINNWRLHVVAPSSTPLETIHETIDFAAMTPHQAALTLQQHPTDLRKVRSVLLGGAPVSQQLSSDLSHHRVMCWEGYGMTETLTHVAVRKVSPESEPFFRCMPGISIGMEHDGTLVLRGDRFPSPLKTTDRIERIDDKHFRWLGRADFTLNTGGIKVQPEQVEAALEGCIERPYVVTGEPDEILGTRVVLIMEGEPLRPSDEESLMNQIGLVLSVYERPKRILYMTELPRTPNGKIARHRL